MPLIENVPGATPLTDLSGLIPSHITARSELNEWEAANILKAVRKYLAEKKRRPIDVVWLKKLHKEMFDETWQWAGQFRKSNFNIGCDWHIITEQVKSLVDDLAYWEKNEGDLSILSRSVRLHHRLVKIHPFVNGNGRHARLASDIYLFDRGHKLPTWPDQELIAEGELRHKYIAALQAADQGSYALLERFTSDLIKRKT